MTENLIIITTYIASGVDDPHMIDQRIKILKYITIPSLCAQDTQNFVWFIYLDKYNNPPNKFNELSNMFNEYKNKIKIYVVEYDPFIKGNILCTHNRARSCYIKRKILHDIAINLMENDKLLNGVKFIAHVMLDDDDPVLKNYISWINNKIKKYRKLLRTRTGIIIINTLQYLFYVNEMKLLKIKSNRALQGCSFLIYKVDNIKKFKLMPKSILKNIDANRKYLEKYNVVTIPIRDDPCWIYFRHNGVTSHYQKNISEKNLESLHGIQKICDRFKFIKSDDMLTLQKYLLNERKSKNVIEWVDMRIKKANKILFIYENDKFISKINGLKLFLSNNFDIKIIDKNHANDLTKFILIVSFSSYNPHNKALMFDPRNKSYKYNEIKLKNISKWNLAEYFKIYKIICAKIF